MHEAVKLKKDYDYSRRASCIEQKIEENIRLDDQNCDLKLQLLHEFIDGRYTLNAGTTRVD